MLQAGAKVEAHPVAPLHVVYPWLQLLLWVADGRWGKLGHAAPLHQLQHLLDCLQGHVALLWTANPNAGNHEESGLMVCTLLVPLHSSQHASIVAHTQVEWQCA